LYWQRNKSEVGILIPLNHILALSVILFGLGAAGFIIRRNIITIFMCIELMLNAVNLAFIAFSRYLGDLNGQIFVFFVIVVAAAEAAVGLAIIIAIERNRQTLAIDEINSMKS
jgi:NADH-quinone oxidoreductase subunit K